MFGICLPNRRIVENLSLARIPPPSCQIFQPFATFGLVGFVVQVATGTADAVDEAARGVLRLGVLPVEWNARTTASLNRLGQGNVGCLPGVVEWSPRPFFERLKPFATPSLIWFVEQVSTATSDFVDEVTRRMFRLWML